MRRKLSETIALAAFVVCLMTGSAWAVPSLINYQGKLTNASDCILTGDYEIQFLLYDTETNGTLLWGEQQTVTVDQGLLNVQLGRSVSFPSGLFDSDSLYLEMVIWNPETSSWETLSPRQRLTSTAYSMKADTSDYAILAGSVADGTISTTGLANDAVTSAKIQDHTIQQEDLAISPFPVDGHSLDAADGDPVDAVYVDNEGNVSIGMMATEGKLNVVGSVGIGPIAYTDQTNHMLDIASTTTNTGQSAIRVRTGATEGGLAGTEFRALSHLDGTAWTAAYAKAGNESATSFGTIALYTDGEVNMMNGNVGIGTASPDYRLTIPPGNNLQLSSLLISGGYCHPLLSNGGSFGEMSLVAGGTLGGSQIVLNSATQCSEPESIQFFTGDNYSQAERMRINGSGNIGIGTTSPSYKLHVIGDIAYTGNIYDVSDLRLKENITPLTNAIEKVSALRGIYFNLKGESPSKREVGVIAQEVERVLPEVVSEDDKGYKSVDYSKLTPLLIEAVKELKKENEALKAQDKAIKALVCQDHPEAQVCQ